MEKILAKESGNDLMLYNVNQDTVHILNPTANLIYNLYKQGKSFEEIEKAVRKNFCSEKNQDISRDIQKCLDELKNKELF